MSRKPDTNLTRQKEKFGDLKRRILKKDAVPSQFPNLPKYFSHAKPQQCSTAALGESQLAKEIQGNCPFSNNLNLL